MQYHPYCTQGAKALCLNAIQRIMPQYEQQAYGSYPFNRETYQCSHNDHAHTNHPEYQQYNKIVIEIKGIRKIHNGEFKDNQHQAAGPQKTGELRRAMLLYTIKESAGTGEEYKYGSTEMRDPPGEKQGRGGLRQIGRAEPDVGSEISYVVQRHDYHYHASQYIQRRNAVFHRKVM